MKSIQFNKDFKASVPETWRIEKSGDLYSAFDESDGLGALQFTLYIFPENESVVDALQDYLSYKHDGVKANLKDNYAYAETTDLDGIYWRYWILHNKRNAIFISYNCEVDDKTKENGIVNHIIKSLISDK